MSKAQYIDVYKNVRNSLSILGSRTLLDLMSLEQSWYAILYNSLQYFRRRATGDREVWEFSVPRFADLSAYAKIGETHGPNFCESTEWLCNSSCQHHLSLFTLYHLDLLAFCIR